MEWFDWKNITNYERRSLHNKVECVHEATVQKYSGYGLASSVKALKPLRIVLFFNLVVCPYYYPIFYVMHICWNTSSVQLTESNNGLIDNMLWKKIYQTNRLKISRFNISFILYSAVR